MRDLRLLLASVLGAGFVCTAEAAIITFEGEALGGKAQPYVVGGVSFTEHNPTSPSGVSVIAGANQCAASSSRCLSVGSDSILDGSIGMSFPGPITSLSLVFGNDDPGQFAANQILARLQAFSGGPGGAVVATTDVVANMNDDGDQTIAVAFAGGFDFATFDYLRNDGTFNDAALTKVIDNVEFGTVPAPATLPLALAAFAGLAMLAGPRWRPA